MVKLLNVKRLNSKWAVSYTHLDVYKRQAKNIIDYLAPIREKRKYYEEHLELVDKILKEGTEKARKVAKETMRDVKKAMKLDYFE